MNVNRTCKKCNEIKILEDFTPNKNCKYGREHECRKCSIARRVKWEYDNYERKHRNVYLKYRFGLTKEQFDQMLNNQNDTCDICKKPEMDKDKRNHRPKRLSVDHCHGTNKIRGLLCRGCNTALGSFKDSISLLNEAIKYLEKHSKK